MADILVIDDQDRTIALCRRVMPEHTWHGPARSWADAQGQLRGLRRRVELVLLDIHFDIDTELLLGLPDAPDARAIRRAQREQGIHILAELRRGRPDLPVVLMTSRGEGLERAADRHGAEEYTYFLDDEDIDARSMRAQVAGILQVRRGLERDGPVYWGRALEMRRIRRRLETLSRGRLPVTLAGPTGTGKSLIARHFVHARSGRTGKFVAIDLSTQPPDLVPSQLFGSVRGAYTGSVGDRRGAFEEADGGTLFLDEIGNLSESVQRMLLTVLQERAVTRIGDTRERQVDVKLVVATNEDLGEMVRQGRFRADLYMRLNPAATVVLPPLKERKVDLDRFLEFCIERVGAEPGIQELVAAYQQAMGLASGGTARVAMVSSGAMPAPQDGRVLLLFPDRTLRLLRQHPWPGNLREFRMTVENAVMLTLAEGIAAGRRPGTEANAERTDVLQIRPKLVRDLLLAVSLAEEGDATGRELTLRVRSNTGLNKVAQDVERQYFTQLYISERGDFGAMAGILLDEPDGARKVQLRFNQLGLKVRDLKDRIS